MGDEDVDAMLDKALDKIEESDKKNGSAEDMIKDRSKNWNKSDKDGSKKRRSRSKSKSTEKNKKKRRHSSSESSSSSSRSRSRSRDRKKKRSRTRSKSRDKRRRRSSSRDRDRRKRSRSRDRRRRSRSHSSSRRRRSRSRSHSYSRRRSRSPGRPRIIDHRGSPPPRWRREMGRSPPRRPVPGPERRDVMPFTPRKSPPPNAKSEMTAEERDDRTVFVQQLARDTRPRDLEEFFSSVGHVRDVRIITDSKTRRSKGIAYVEFWEREAVPLALGLGGQRLLNAPLIITATMAQMNRDATNKVYGGALGFAPIPQFGSLKLCVSNLHPSINEEMLGAIFDPFGKIDEVDIPMADRQNNKGYGYVIFRHADDAKRALEQLNGFELAGKNMRVTAIDENPVKQEEEDVKPNVTNGRQQPPPPQPPPSKPTPRITQPAAPQTQSNIPPIATQCFMLSNMFDPGNETEDGWDLDVRDDVIDECMDHGGVVHIFVDKASSQGNVYVKCPTVEVAFKSVNALHGRWFAGKVITANYVPVDSYHALFPDSKSAVTLMKSRPRN